MRRGTWLTGRAGSGRASTVLGVDLTPATASGYVRRAFDLMLAVADRLGDDRVNDRPLGPSDASLVLHVTEELYQHLGHCELAADALLR
jgi:hypothetical protein